MEKDEVPTNTTDVVKWNGWGFKDSEFFIKDDVLYFTGTRYNIGGGGNVPLTYFKDWACSVLNIDTSAPSIPRQHTLPTTYPATLISQGNHEDVCRIVDLAVEKNLVIIPFGGGTSVSGACCCPSSESRPIIALDTSRMCAMLKLNKENLSVCFEAGITGRHMEAILKHEGLTCGHEPDSYEFSSLGGWVATRASGMKKNVYGNIEDIVVGYKIVTARGTFEKKLDVPRVSCGPDFSQLILGSEGTLGVVTEVTVKVRPLPEFRIFNSFVFQNFESGLKCIREIARQRCQPASVRLMDNEQFKFGQALRHSRGLIDSFKEYIKRYYLISIKKFDLNEMCVMTVLLEGHDWDEVDAHLKKLKKIAELHRGLCAGEKNGKIGYDLTFVIAYIRDLALTYQVVAESFETSVPWDKTLTLCNQVKNCVRNCCEELSIKYYLISCRVSQTYDTGCCVYFYLAFNWMNQSNPVSVFEHLESLAREEILKCGGSLSHHHGIGKIRSKFYVQEVSEYGADLYRVIKHHIDPLNTFSVGNILSHL